MTETSKKLLWSMMGVFFISGGLGLLSISIWIAVFGVLIGSLCFVKAV